jgi:RNA polymerase sigma-70 factor (ECF subfamily)
LFAEYQLRTAFAMVEKMDQESRYNLFVSLLARHDQAIRRFVRSLLPSTEGVDDVLQETALECWKKFSDFTPNNPEDAADEFIRWACVIARYKALSWQRDKARDRLVFRESVVEKLAQAAMDQIRQQEQERLAVECCLSKLQDDQRRLVLSVHSPGESIARIAAETGEKARRLYSKVNVLRGILLDCVQQRLAGEVSNG